eukprot:15496442-Heterocapsa_arctica.AAC.1
MDPRPGNSEEISFQLATTVNQDGTSSGMYYVTPDNGVTYGNPAGQIGYVVNIMAALRDGIKIYRTPGGDLSVPYGG